MNKQTPHEPNLGPGSKASEVAARALEDARHEGAYVEMITSFLAAGLRVAATPAAAVLAALTCGVILLSEATALAGTLAKAVSAGDGVYVYFDGVGGRGRCVRLNPIARAVASALYCNGPMGDVALRSFLDWLDASGPKLLQDLSDNRPAQITAIERGGAVFWRKHLPQLFLSDALGLLTLRPLRPEALARWVSGQPLAASVAIGPALFAASAGMLSMCASKVTPIDGSDVIHQVVAIMKSGDGNHLAALRAGQLRALTPLLDEAEGDTIGLLMVTLAAGFCEQGTLQKSDPSHSLTSRYIQELAAMFLSMPALAALLPELGPEARREAYARLLQHGKDPNDAKAALSNADMHLCEATGCEPARFVYEDLALEARRPTRYLSALERQAVADISPTLATTSESQVVTGAVSAIATNQPVRPGDMLDACFEDLEIYKHRVVLNLRRRAGRKGQKTSTAEGPMEFTKPEVMKKLAALKELREGQSALDDDPLWGRDLQESRRLYVQACALVDRVSKHYSGDRIESFYSCRHGIISDELFHALMIENPAKAQAAAKAVSIRARHRDLRTTTEEYFRFGPEVLHHRANRGLGTLLTWEIAHVWSSVLPNAMKQSFPPREGMGVDAFWMTIHIAAPPPCAFPSIHDEHRCAPSTRAPKAARLKLDDIAFSQICLQTTFEEGAPVHSALDQAAIAASPWAAALLEARTRYARHWADAVRPASTRQRKLRGIARRLRSHPDASAVTAATRLWRATAKNGFIDVSDLTSLHQWVTFLVDAGIPASRLVLRLDETALPKVEALSALFAKGTGYRPAIDEVPSGKGRPAVYLMVSSKEVQRGGCAPPRAVEMSGFNAWFLAACMAEDLRMPSAMDQPQ